MNRVTIALGSNIDKEKNLPLAVQLLCEMCHVTAVSSVYETRPMGLADQPTFFNAAVCADTELSAARLKAEVLSVIESKLQRKRVADKNAPRTIDVDIVLYNGESFEYTHSDGRLRQVPDPDLLRFPHVAVPVAELAPDMPHPLTGEPLSEIAKRLTLAATDDSGRPPLRKRSDISARVRKLLLLE